MGDKKIRYELLILIKQYELLVRESSLLEQACLAVKDRWPSEKSTNNHALSKFLAFRVELYWSESERESDVAWNGYLDFLVVCLH